MDRCALFVDAGYVLADGAMAEHGTSRRESVSWDYPGLLQFFANLAADRTGQPLLRCYWYEATVDGRRSAEHDTLADMPGLTLRLGQTRPGKREGVETEIDRDLTTLARNRAISDVVLVSADGGLAQVIADVQDLGVRVIIVHISADGDWTVSRSLLQQGDDIVEIDGAQLRPFAKLTASAEPARYSEQYATSGYGGKPLANGHATSATGAGHPACRPARVDLTRLRRPCIPRRWPLTISRRPSRPRSSRPRAARPPTTSPRPARPRSSSPRAARPPTTSPRPARPRSSSPRPGRRRVSRPRSPSPPRPSAAPGRRKRARPAPQPRRGRPAQQQHRPPAGYPAAQHAGRTGCPPTVCGAHIGLLR